MNLEIENAKQVLESKGYTIIDKDKLVVTREVPRDVLENVFVTAIEGGSNYWYYLSENAIRIIRNAVPKSEEKYLSIAMVKAVLEHNVRIPINDAEYEDEILGYLSMDTLPQRLNKLANSDDSWALSNELDDNADASSSDVVFQYLVMGEVVYG
jgi:hypothetical protein